jgi:zinc finger protein
MDSTTKRRLDFQDSIPADKKIKMAAEDTTKQTPEEFFQSIGDKVNKLAPAAVDAQNADDDERAVEEIESLCMNCGKNVSQIILEQVA